VTVRALIQRPPMAAMPSSILRRSLVKGGAQAAKAIAPPIVHDALATGGQALPSPMRQDMEGRLGHDLSGVRVHSDAKAAAAAGAVHADAFTVGRDIVLGTGKWDGTALNGLLAHELVHAVQQSGAGGAGDGPLPISSPDDAAEREAELMGSQLMAGQPARPRTYTGAGLFRQPKGESVAPAEVKTIEGSAASVSWIDPAAGLPASVSDAPPPQTATISFLKGSSGFRFSNYLHAWISTSDSVRVAGFGFHSDSDIYRGPSYLGIPSHAYPVRRTPRRITEAGVERVEFDQLVGARTVSAGVIGGVVGAGVGALTGALIGGAVAGPLGAAIGGIGGAIVGWGAGAATANAEYNFPPIWTHLRLSLKANGERRCSMAAVPSLFPSISQYCDLTQVWSHSGTKSHIDAWQRTSWDGGNPWGVSRPVVTP
jgi:hypothetical protein